MTEEVQKHSVHTLVFRSLKRAHDMFLSEYSNPVSSDPVNEKLLLSVKAKDEYGPILHLGTAKESQKDQRQVNGGQPATDIYYPGAERHADLPPRIQTGYSYPNAPGVQLSADTMAQHRALSEQGLMQARQGLPPSQARRDQDKVAAGIYDIQQNAGLQERIGPPATSKALVLAQTTDKTALVPRKAPTMPKPQWHPPWKLFRVISGHWGWVRCIAVEPGNEWFVTGAADRVIKIWDLATGQLKLSLTGHVSTVRGVAVSSRQPYLFSCGEDKQVKCWDLEYNKVIRHYHGHLSACYGLDLHPTIDVLLTCSRDSTARVWDMRTKACVHTLVGHSNTVADVKCQAVEPQVITGSHDSTVRLWDLAAGKSRATLTNHKKSVRAVQIHPTLHMFASASPDNIKQWRFPDGNFVQNLSGHSAIVNSLALNTDNVLVSGGDNGTLHFWDWKTGYNFQRFQAPVQPGSIDSEAGVFAMTYDLSGSRLLTAEADKTIKIYKEDDSATEESHPINWKPEIIKKRRY
ncbi:PREDICTED: pleiotropic regulator 1-like [Priapulus caudatus]|uniref:Pleiotropic regulator 1-like n=1 Tax=Priapulus caudatus TaxID=37621 RepID=A0ABM1EQ38_PRICU|nr:PREDICTED: pleiotropic regulator 1-like [Priapulus caudatus]